MLVDEFSACRGLEEEEIATCYPYPIIDVKKHK